ncbi:MAG TPA: hypothetical protein VNE39_00675 [Planctomycetota bacterium]|nr:hypothetical protein [Planctomycetota bacterium]
MTPEERIESVLRETQPLKFPRGGRLPLYVWPAMDLPGDDAQVETTLKALDARGIAACASWRPGKDQQQSLDRALRRSAVQKRLGLRVNINANACTYSICDGSEATAHLDAEGKPFFDTSSAERRKLGCPFRLQHRYPAMREQVDFFCRAYKEKGMAPDFVVADWEIDGPIEWNGGWDAAKRCTVCRKNIPRMDDFLEFQKAYRRIRSEVQRECYASVVLKHFPKALVGNYGVYPHGGWRYWYDYFETDPPKGCPVRMDQRAPYRPWAHEFEGCGYTFAMPVVYTWYRIWSWYDWPNGDYRWFYALLLEASSVGQATPAATPVITFVHHTTTSPPKDPDPAVKQFSSDAYRELLWHMLLRGHDTFFLWCPETEIAQEIRPLHETWAAALEFRDFLDKGEPVAFDVPKQPGPVVSGLRLGNRLLVRRTDFDDTREPVALKVGDATVAVPRVEGKCQVLSLPE